MSRTFSLRPALSQADAAWMVGGGLLLAAWNVQSADAVEAAQPASGAAVETAQLETDRIETAQLGVNPLPAEAAAVAEVVITARRREERLQDVPLSISALSGEFVQEQNLVRIQEFAARIPNFNPDTSNPRTSSLSIRGVGGLGSGSDGSESGVGQIVDNVFYTHVGFGWAPLYDLESIEVARGPQGTLLGKNTTVGAVILRTKAPSFTAENGVDISPRNYKGLQTSAYSTGALVEDRVAYRLSYYSDKDEGLVPNPSYPIVQDDQRDEKRLLDTNRWAARGQLLFKFADGDATSRVIYDHISSDEFNNYSGIVAPILTQYSDGAAFPLYETRIRNLYGIEQIDYDPWTGDATNPSKLPSSTDGLSNELNWNIGEYTFTSVTAWRKFELYPRNTQGYNGIYSVSTGYDVEAEQYSQEFRLASAVSDIFDWQVGSFFLKDDRDSNYRFLYGRDAATFLLNDKTANPAILNNVEHDSFGKAHTRSYAAFGQGTWHVLSNVDLTAGLRLTHEKRSGSNDGYSFGGAQDLPAADQTRRDNYLFTARSGDFSVDGSKKDTSVSWLVNPSWKINPDLLVYGSVAQGSKSGAINTDARPIYAGGAGSAIIETQAVVIDPEKATDYELGFKKSWPELRTTLNVNLYQNDIKDYQGVLVGVFTDPATGSLLPRQYLGNIDHVRLRGVEIEGSWSPTRRLNVWANAAITEAKYVDFANAPPTQGARVQNASGAWVNTTETDLSGTDIPNVPEWTANLGFDYDQPIGNFQGSPIDLFFYVNEAVKGDTRYSTEADLNYRGQDAYALTNAGIGIRRPDRSFALTLWGKNVFDERYYDRVNLNNATAPATVRLGQPLTFGVTLSLRLS
ncbi:TonB-dependent receptor [Hydrocarboniphaga effusa]|jgi:iron complex outermembrane receptor protein|uniref:TonB-dependent receptor n=1 Tax=Hydrocarboniphaga effusa TaxID=243629 RepID=UPI003137D193